MTYCLKNSSRVFAPNIVTSSLLPLFSRLTLTLSGPSKPAPRPSESISGLTFLHDFIEVLELQDPAMMVVAAARQLAHLNPDNTLILFSLINQEKKIVMAGRKPSSLIKNEILKLRKKHSTANPPLAIIDATDNEIGSTIDQSETFSVAAATDPGFMLSRFVLYSTAEPTAKESQLFNYCLQHLKKRVSEAISRQDLEKSARLDALTGLHNRRHFDEIIKKESERAERYHHPTSLIMLDLDYFKKVNDNFGHQTGDLVLQSLGKILLEQVRQSDTPCRYGGEEFALILPETGLCEAQRIAERIRQAIEQQNIITHNNIHLRVTASLGIASTDNNRTTDLIAAADQALYRAKESGRNQIATSQNTPHSAVEPVINHCFPAQAVLV
ncbi:MAG: GGDEF domain-containing protein [Pseudomonadota bacterium]|nr:GGDEF domain-containing protein [Pseudomonadota bacterium]